MTEELKQKLESALVKKGLKKELSQFITIKDESEIQGAIDLLKLEPKELKPSEMLENPEVKKEIDRRVTQAIKTYSEKNPKKDPEKKEGEGDDKTMTAIEELKKTIAEMKTQKSTEAKKSLVDRLFKESGLPSHLRSTVEFTIESTEEEIKKSIESIKEVNTDYLQKEIDKRVTTGGIPPSGKLNKAMTDEQMQQYLVVD